MAELKQQECGEAVTRTQGPGSVFPALSGCLCDDLRIKIRWAGIQTAGDAAQSRADHCLLPVQTVTYLEPGSLGC